MTLRSCLVLAGLCWLALPALANPHRLDDSLSHTVPPNVQMQWRELPTSQPGASGMEAWLRVNVRIDTRNWAGRFGRVYMVLPRDQTSNIEAVWTSQGRLQAGRLVSGERSLVYAGTMPAATLEDQLLVRLRSGPDWQGNSRRLNFHFELDAD
ncbi:MAG: hypothetical protein U1B84_31180 [Variovorax sp.]|nr:hypothetical protein [Hydrogenophaga sp.]MDZ4360829.1 hypothetical protein [Variovorax sp.]